MINHCTCGDRVTARHPIAVKINPTSRLKLLLTVFIIFIANVATAQTGIGSVVMEQYVDGKKFIQFEMLISGQLQPTNELWIFLIPKFYENGQLLSKKQIDRYKLDCKLNPANINLTPDSYFGLSLKDKKIHSITEQSNLIFEPLGDEFKHDTLIINFTFTLVQGKMEFQSNAGLKVVLPVSKVINTPIDTEMKAKPIEPLKSKEAQIAINYDQRIQLEKTEVMAPKSDIQQKADVQELLQFVDGIKDLHQQLFEFRLHGGEKKMDQIESSKYKIKAEQLKNQFETKYSQESFDNPESAERLFKNFSYYYLAAKKLLEETASETSPSKTVTAAKEEMNATTEPAKKNDQSDMILYLIIFIAVIALVFAVVVLIMKRQKQKNQLNIQKQMQRKVTMELNKQKFQASQQTNKFKI